MQIGSMILLSSTYLLMFLPSAIFQVFQYDLILAPDLTETFTTSGQVTMHMQGRGSNKIHLHAKQMIIDEDSVTIEPKVDIVGHEYDLDREFYVIHLKELYEIYLVTGNSKLSISRCIKSPLYLKTWRSDLP